ncbi:hypothetical protein [Roseobacter sinensis]|uniref:Uncharacterized protein n=1 Tax=Roseobacter sinensis TaxID=2931391 RepID=A0ABT3BLE9_9RHOB|nr:hypothetical protein [Roseobacter sp. WL0113]MCV3273944.1 hypothetical protein [Roseobacter sp. WL0113]
MTAPALPHDPAAPRQLREAALVFAGNILICLTFFPPEVQGLGDAIRGWDQFNRLLMGGEPVFGPANQIALRVSMAAASSLLLVALILLRLVEHRVVVTYLALPVSAYLATKIRIEFIFFPLALISTRLGWKKEMLVLAALLALSLGLDERNGLILVVYRVGVFLFRTFRPHTVFIFLAVAVIVWIDLNIELLFPYIPRLAVYNWTREVVNPEFSHLETLIVFTSSMTMSLQPPLDFMFGFTYTAFLLFATFGWQLFTLRFYVDALRQPEFRAGFLTILFFTSLTHAFQNARYYFFYVPMISSVNAAHTNRLLILASWPMTALLVLYYRFYLGY